MRFNDFLSVCGIIFVGVTIIYAVLLIDKVNNTNKLCDVWCKANGFISYSGEMGSFGYCIGNDFNRETGEYNKYYITKEEYYNITRSGGCCYG